jgi:hypothetical protein
MRFLILCLGVLPLIAQDAPKPAQEPAQTEQAKPAQEPKPAEEAKPADEPKPAEAKPAGEQAKTEEKAATSDRVWSGSVDVGYRFVNNIGGNVDAYRTVVNLGEGLKVFNFDFSLTNPSGKYADKVSLFGTGWGGEPNEATRLDVSKQRVYDFYFDYRNIAYYNFLPSFANPLIDRNVYVTQRGYDIRRRTIDTELRFRPGTRIIPYVAYGRNWGDGRGVSTFAMDSSNEYPVFNSLYDRTDQYRVGVNFEFTKFHFTVEQGGTTFKDDQTLSTSDKNFGSRTTPIFGQTLFLSSLVQSYRIRGDSIFERALGTWTPADWIDLSGMFLYSRPRTDVGYTQNNTGNFVNLATLQFFTSQTETATANSSRPHTSGNVNAELRPFRRLTFLESWMTDRYSTESAIALTNLVNITPQALTTSSGDRLMVNYNREQIQGNIDVFSWLTVRAGFRYVWGDASVRAPAVVGTPLEQGQLSQRVGLFGFQMRSGQRLWVNGDAEIASANSVYFRTSLGDYRKGTIRVRYQLFNSFALTGNFAALTNHNPNPNIGFDLESYQSTAGFLWNPGGGKRVTILGDYTRSSLETSLSYFVPQTLTPELSRYHENAHIGTALVDIAPIGGKYAPKLSAGGSFFVSSGSRPTSFFTPILKLNVPVHERVQFFAEWRYYGLSEAFYLYEGFRSNLFMTGLRLVR